MPLPNQYARSTMYYEGFNGRLMQLVLWHVPVGTITIDQSVADGVASNIDSAYGTQLASRLASNAQYVGTISTLHDSGITWTGSSTAGAIAGLVGGDCQPDFVCVVLQKKSGVPGRRGIGRWRIGGVPEADTTNNRLQPGPLAAYLVLANFLANDMLIGATTWHSMHHSQKNVTLTQILAVSADVQLGRLSRREVQLPF